MKVNIRKLFRIFVWIIAIFIGLWLLVWGYVIINKKSLIAQVNAELTRRVKGEININDLEPSLLSTFPNVSIRLSQVTVRDSLWKNHHHDLFKADKVFVRLGLFSLFTGSPEIKKIIINEGALFIFSDTSGYSNEYLFQSKKSGEASSTGSKPKIPDIELNKVTLTVDLKDRDKLIDFNISQLKCDVNQKNENLLKFNIKTDILVRSLAFNTDRGSFVTGKTVNGKFDLDFDLAKKKLDFTDINLKIDDHPFNLTGMFDFSTVPLLFYFDIQTKNVNFKKASSLVSKNIKERLDSFIVEKPIDVNAVIDGRTLPNKMPFINVTAKIENNDITIPLGRFTKASLLGRFTNKVVKSERCSDANSGLFFTNGSAKWENISIRSDSVKILDLEHPIMDCDIHSSFKLSGLNDVLATNTIDFASGTCKADVTYHGIIMKSDTASASLFGKVSLEQASIRYIPRNLLFTNCSGNLVFDDKDFYVKELKTHIGNTDLFMEGAVKNLTSLIDKSPEKSVLNWNISSPKIVLSDFISFLNTKSAAVSKKKSSKKLMKLANQVDKMLNECNVDLRLNADRLIYKKFTANKVVANLSLSDKTLMLKNVQVEHGDGTLVLNGALTERANQNLIMLNADMNNVDVTKIFTAFDNFGQDGIKDKNLRGRLSAKVALTGSITSKAEIDPNSMNGTVDFHLKDGELINFEPVKNISQVAFKNRDFSNIRFADLHDKLEFKGSEIKLNRMEIQSTVFTMFVEGIYDVKKGTDLGIQIPLSNLAKRGEDFELKNKGVNSKTGMSINLRARTGDDGKAKISWDPFKLALKKSRSNKEDSSPSDSTKVKSKR